MIAGVGAVLGFLPQMMVLFLLLALLDSEDAPLEEMLDTALQFGKQAVCYCNEAMKQTVDEDTF